LTVRVGEWEGQCNLLLGMAHKLFTPRQTAAGYLEKFFEGHDHARLSWLHEIGRGPWGHAAGTMMSMVEGPSAAGTRIWRDRLQVSSGYPVSRLVCPLLREYYN
jgi:hypothetical protein